MESSAERFCEECGRALKSTQKRFCCKSCDNKNRGRTRGVEEKKKILHEMFDGRCSMCGYSKNLAAIEFHHLDPSTKSFELSTRRFGNRDWDVLIAEARKCIAVCANCHRDIHYGIIKV